MKIALVGAGSLGIIIGGLLTEGGADVTLVDANAENVDALNQGGAVITGYIEKRIPVKAVTPAQLEGTFDTFIYTCKSTFDEAALPPLLPHFADGAWLVTLQNGVPEERVAACIGRERTLGGTVGFGATWQKPGVSELTSEPDKMTYDIGEMDGAVSERLAKTAQLLNTAGTAEITTNLIGVRWTKLLVNISFSGMSTVIGGDYGAVLDSPQAVRAAANIIVECIDTGSALGIRFEPMQGADPTILKQVVEQDMENAIKVLELVFGPHRHIRGSMLQDLEKGLRSEVDTLNGYLSVKGREAGVPTPVNDIVVGIIRDIQDGGLRPGPDNLELFSVIS
ncbi:MAG: ketopantoate reductase family protein [Candidatus Geothermincolia bacterium]